METKALDGELNHLEQNVRAGLNDPPTLTELSVVSLYSKAISVPFSQCICDTSSNGLDLGPDYLFTTSNSHLVGRRGGLQDTMALCAISKARQNTAHCCVGARVVRELMCHSGQKPRGERIGHNNDRRLPLGAPFGGVKTTLSSECGPGAKPSSTRREGGHAGMKVSDEGWKLRGQRHTSLLLRDLHQVLWEDIWSSEFPTETGSSLRFFNRVCWFS